MKHDLVNASGLLPEARMHFAQSRSKGTPNPPPSSSKAIPRTFGTRLLGAEQTGTARTAGFTLPCCTPRPHGDQELLAALHGALPDTHDAREWRSR